MRGTPARCTTANGGPVPLNGDPLLDRITTAVGGVRTPARTDEGH